MSTSMGAEREVRIGLVLYGGVSLAIYINGVVQEFLHLVKATADGAGEGVTGTQIVYRKLSRMLAGQGSEVDGAPVRFVIDAIAGTSAGGINGVFLAKALALNGDLEGIKKLWVEEGDIAKLINDEGSVKGDDDMQPYELQSPPASLLNSQRMYVKLLKALQGMRPGEGESLAKELDLHITATDLYGLAEDIQLADGSVKERLHKAEFHFRYSEFEPVEPDAPGASVVSGTGPAKPGEQLLNQFTAEYDPVLAFAARCTSSFPMAFEPMTLRDIRQVVNPNGVWSAAWEQTRRLCLECAPAYRRGDAFSDPERGHLSFENRPMADGGYLDNKPFSFVIDEILKRQAELPVNRVMFYVEPDPEQGEGPKAGARRPNAIANAWSALTSLPRYETIRGDLERARRRNGEIGRLRDLIRTIEVWARGVEFPKLEAGEWVTLTRADLARQFGPGYVAYHAVKVSSVTDDLTALLCRHYGVSTDSLEGTRLRYLIEAWRDTTYEQAEEKQPRTLNKFLLDFDVKFRLRRIHYLFRKLAQVQEQKEETQERRDCARMIRARLLLPYKSLLRLQRKSHKGALAKLGVREDLVQLLDGAPGQDRDGLQVAPWSSEEEREDWARKLLEQPHVRPAIEQVTSDLRAALAGELTGIRRQIDEALKPADGEAQGAAQLRREVEDLSDKFERYDMLTFPLIFNTEVGEMDEIEIYRVSPLDAPLGVAMADGKVKVKGAALGAFAGFLEQQWRENDILWGRLDGAERIISAMLPMEEPQEARRELIECAHVAIIEEELAKQEKLWLSGLKGKNLLAKWMHMRLEEQQRGPWARTLARSTTVIGDLLDAIARRTNAQPTPLSGVAHVGRLAWGLIEVSTPRRYSELAFRYWMTVLFAVGVVLVVVGVVLPAVQTAGWMIVGLTVAAKLASAYLQDWFQEAPDAKHRPTLVLVGAAAAAVALPVTLFFAALGVAHASGPLPLWTNRFAFWVAAAAVVLTMVRMVQVGRASKGLPLPSIEGWKTVGDVERDCGDVRDDRRSALRRHLEADQRFVAAYALLFGAMGFAMLRTGGVVEGLALAVLGVGAAVADYFENERISRNIAASLRELSPVGAPAPVALDLPVAPVSMAKWVLFYALLPFAASWLLRDGVGVAAQVAGWAMAASCVSGVISLVRRDAQFQAFSLLVLLVPGLPALGVYWVMRALGA